MATIQTQELIEQFCQLKPYVDGLIYVEDTDSFLLYDEHNFYYKKLLRTDLKKEIFKFIQTSGKNFSRGLILDMEEGIKYLCYRQIPTLQKNYISFRDGLLNLNTLEFEKHNPKNIAYNYFPTSINDLDKPIPVWEKFICEIMVDLTGRTDEELILVIEEMLGFYLIEEMKPEAMFFLTGNGSNGKSRVLGVLEGIVGSEYTKYRSLESITGYQFAAVDLLGNKMNIIRDDESKYIKVDKLKTLVSGEAITADRKNLGSVDFTPKAKIICSTNRTPTFSGLDYGLKRRLNFIPFNRRFSAEERDHTLEAKLAEEIPRILWQIAVKGARRLRENNYMFTKSSSMEHSMKEFEEEVSSAIEFVRENYKEDDNAFIFNEDLYTAYDIWCRKSGRKPMSDKNFFKDINDICKTEKKWSAEKGNAGRGKKLALLVQSVD